MSIRLSRSVSKWLKDICTYLIPRHITKKMVKVTHSPVNTFNHFAPLSDTTMEKQTSCFTTVNTKLDIHTVIPSKRVHFAPTKNPKKDTTCTSTHSKHNLDVYKYDPVQINNTILDELPSSYEDSRFFVHIPVLESNSSVAFHIDTGSDITLLPLTFVERHIPQPTLQASNISAKIVSHDSLPICHTI